jgi:C1A family cysteine protease
MALAFKPRLTWKPDNTQPVPAGQSAFTDATLANNLHKLQAVARAMPNAIVEKGGVLDLRPFCPPIDNQLQVSDCVADGTCTGVEFMQIRDGLPFIKKSRLFIYYNARLAGHEIDKDEGTYVRLAFASLSSFGTCKEDTWPYDPRAVFTRPSWAAYQEAYPQRITSFFNIDDAIVNTGGTPLVSAIKQALQAQHPVVFGQTVDEAFMDVGSDGLIPAYDMKTAVDPGGHCTVIVGYNDNTQRFIVQNSWGTDWGDDGFYHELYTDLDARSADDFWVPLA